MKADNRVIYILESGIAQEIGANTSEYVIKIKEGQINLPIEIEKKVHLNWEKFREKNGERARDQATYFFTAYDKLKCCDYVFKGPFRYVQAFGRTKEFEKYAGLAAANHLIALSSLCLVVTSDNKMIFGIKENMDGRISGFSGYISERFVRGNQVNLYEYIGQSVIDELNIKSSNISSIIRVGQTYSHQIYDAQNKLNTKVYNNDFIMELDCTATQVLEGFKENFQFSKLMILDCDEEELSNFIVREQSQLSIHCIGAIYNYMVAINREDKAKEMISGLNCKIVAGSQAKEGMGEIGKVIKNLNLFNWGLIGGGQISCYSVAPQMWRALFEHLNYPVNYFVIAEDHGNNVVAQIEELISSGNLIGGNVAMPWKQIVSNKCDIIDEEVKQLGIINTFIFKEGKLKGYNTDGKGLVEVIKEKIDIENKKVLIMGAGGACQTLPLYLIKNSVDSIYVYDIVEEKVEMLIHKYTEYMKSHSIHAIAKGEIGETIRKADIIINASPCGMQNYKSEMAFSKKELSNINPDALVVEMVYNPYQTPLLQSVKASQPICEGINMLVEQAAQSFYHGFGIGLDQASKNVMREAAQAALV